MNGNVQRGSRARTPDLDWSQVQETVLMLQLKIVQIEGAMRDGENSVQSMAPSFMGMAGILDGLQARVADAPELQADIQEMQQRVQQTIMSFQFFDRLVQRLDHVSKGLEGLSRLVADRQRLYSPEEWVALQEGIRAMYTTTEERAMFDAVMAGMPVQEALETFRAPPDAGAGDVELF